MTALSQYNQQNTRNHCDWNTKKHTYYWHEFDKAVQEGLEVFSRAANDSTGKKWDKSFGDVTVLSGHAYKQAQ